MNGVFQISKMRGIFGVRRAFSGSAARIRFSCCSVTCAEAKAENKKTNRNGNTTLRKDPFSLIDASTNVIDS